MTINMNYYLFSLQVRTKPQYVFFIMFLQVFIAANVSYTVTVMIHDS